MFHISLPNWLYGVIMHSVDGGTCWK